MHKFKFADVVKYALLKTVLSSVIGVVSSAFNKEGNQQMIGFALFTGILSLFMIYLVLLALRKVTVKENYYLFLLVFLLLAINEITGVAIEKDTHLFAVLVNGKSWQIAYKIGDMVSVLLSSYLCLIIPIRNRTLNTKPS